MKNKLDVLRILFVLVFGIAVTFFVFSSAEAEILYVCTNGDMLNGRSAPNKHAPIEAHFTNGQAVEAISYCDGWIEVVGGETGTVWCHQDYLSASKNASKYRNVSGGRVFVRDAIEGRKTGLEVVSNKVVTVHRQMDGWGYIGTGWVDLKFFKEEL